MRRLPSTSGFADRQAKTARAEVLKRYEKWKEIIALSGPNGAQKIKGFHDEALKGGVAATSLASHLGLQYRVIYKVIKAQVLVQVVNFTPHDYRKK